MPDQASSEERRDFSLIVLGRTLELLGTQMYKQREPAIAELVANCWDAGATEVSVEVPEENEYDRESSVIVIRDNGIGMSDDQVQSDYLIVGRNRREQGQTPIRGRPVIGRKGIGKLAGLGIASVVTVCTWQRGRLTEFSLDAEQLKADPDGVSKVTIPGLLKPVPQDYGAQGTELCLSRLKHVTPIRADNLHESLARRFSRRIKGEMRVLINGDPLREPNLDLERRCPERNLTEHELPSGLRIRYYYGFSRTVIPSKELRGFVLYVRGKTVQAPPFFFDVEGTASGQHGTRYVTGEIEADFIDEGTDDESDIISTDRQEIDWNAEVAQELLNWGQELSRRVLREWVEFRGQRMESQIFEDEELATRIDGLDPNSQQQVRRFLRTLGGADGATEQARELADALVRAYEFRVFHDVVSQIEDVGDDPERLHELLKRLYEWKVLESRAILEIVKGRLQIVDKFHEMIVSNAPETAPRQGRDNIHDLIARYPWLLDPEWQVLAEEQRISTRLRMWAEEDITDEDERLRYDFLALADERRTFVIDIKRPGHAVELDELQRLETYREHLSRGEDRDVSMVLVYGGNLNVTSDTRQAWEERSDALMLEWSQVHERARQHYEHYRAILESDINAPDFGRGEREVSQTRLVLDSGTAYRSPEERREGLGPQDVDYLGPTGNTND